VLVAAKVLSVRCVNCNTSTGDHLATIGIYVAVIGVLLAALALIVSGIALTIARREHAEFMKQLNASAEFLLSVGLAYTGGPRTDTVHVHGGGLTIARVEIGINNMGTKSARATTLTVIAPAPVQGFDWTNSQGEKEGDPAVISTTHNRLPGINLCVNLFKQIDLVKRRTPSVHWVQIKVDDRMPEIPIRVTAHSDDLPEDAPEASVDFILRVAVD
jgi:hypothetical protein